MENVGKEVAAITLPGAATETGEESARLKVKVPEQWLGFVVPSVLLLLWELLSRAGIIPANWLPAPTVVVGTIRDLFAGGELPGHIAVTIWRVIAGFVLGAVTATLLGVLTGSSPLTRRLLDPLLQSLRNIPSMAWVPLFLLWLGIHETSKIALIAAGVFFPVYLNLLSGILNVDRKLVEVGLVFRLSGGRLIRRIILPATLPAYIVGLRSGLGLGWMFVVAAEIMGASKGLGFLMIDGQMTGRPAIILASIILFALFGKLTDLLVEGAGQRLLCYRDY